MESYSLQKNEINKCSKLKYHSFATPNEVKDQNSYYQMCSNYGEKLMSNFNG